MFMRYLGGGVGHMGRAGTSTRTAFDDEEYDWQDIEEDNIEDGAGHADEDTEEAEADEVVASEQDVQRLVEDLRGVSRTTAADAEDDADGLPSDEEDDDLEPEEVIDDVEMGGVVDEDEGEPSDDEYEVEGFAPL